MDKENSPAPVASPGGVTITIDCQHDQQHLQRELFTLFLGKALATARRRMENGMAEKTQ